MILVGTSGFDYDDWRGSFYPEGLPKRSQLEYYSGHFAALELNFSYYRLPGARQLSSMVERTGGRVAFAIKAHRSMTHERTAGEAEYRAFADALLPLEEAGALAAVLAQFPHSFSQCEENRAYLRRLADRLGPRLVFEPRNDEWVEEPVLNWLGKIGVALCCVDEPALPGLMPPVARATASPAYVRFHGRNAAKWYRHDAAHERYDWRYSAGELSEWVSRVRELDTAAEKVLVFFNNHFQAKAVDAARLFCGML